jgi:hypothetical protein
MSRYMDYDWSPKNPWEIGAIMEERYERTVVKALFKAAREPNLAGLCRAKTDGPLTLDRFYEKHPRFPLKLICLPIRWRVKRITFQDLYERFTQLEFFKAFQNLVDLRSNIAGLVFPWPGISRTMIIHNCPPIPESPFAFDIERHEGFRVVHLVGTQRYTVERLESLLWQFQSVWT